LAVVRCSIPDFFCIFTERFVFTGVQYIMRQLLFFLFSLAATQWLFAQSISNRQPAKATLVQARDVVTAQRLRAQDQMLQWKKLTQQEPTSANAWLQYYIWTSRAQQNSSSLNTILNRASAHINTSSEYALMQFFQSGKTDSLALSQALQRSGNRASIYPFAIQYGIIRNNQPYVRLYCDSLMQVQPIEKGSSLYWYHHNVLQSADDSAIVYARGEHDLVPMAMLQYIHGVRTDIQLRYYSDLLPAHEKTGNNTRGHYLCLSTGSDVLAMQQDMQLTGLLALRTQDTAYAARLLQQSLQNMQLSYLVEQNFSGTLAELHCNYLPAFIRIYQYEQQINAAGVMRYRLRIEKIAQEGGRLHIVRQYLNPR
jgi:hypothetical protein